MVDIGYIRLNRAKIEEAVKNKGIILNIGHLLSLDDRKKETIQQVEKLRSERNRLSRILGDLDLDSAKRSDLTEQSKKFKNQLIILEKNLKSIGEELDPLLLKVPSIISPDTPIGKNDTDNVEIHSWGKRPTFSFTPKNHIQLGKELDILDLERGAKVGGYRGYYIKNEGVSLVMGFMMYAIAKMVSFGYVPMLPPTLVKGFALFGSGYFKSPQYDSEIDEIYQVASSEKELDGGLSKDNKFLIGTAEPALLAYHAGEIIPEEILPLKLCGFSQCYRSEIGSYGKDTKGIYRVHEFMKVEQVILSKADIDESVALQDEMVKISREMHEEIGLPYRILKICTGDMSPGKYRAFDIEAWLPGLNRWGETGSSSNLLDWQSRRLNVRYAKDGGGKKYVYMLNNTALPSPRIFIAILENFQQADGSVIIPDVLQRFMPIPLKTITRKS